MQQQPPSLEQRVIFLETKVAELERKATAQEDRDIALLARVDGFIDDLRRVERVQMRSFDELKAGQQELRRDVGGLKSDVNELKAGQRLLVEATRDHKEAIESIAANVTAILNLARGSQQKFND